MSQTFLEAKTTLDILVSDPKNQKWTATQKKHFLNQALQDVVSSESIPYIRVSEIPIRDGEYEYEFPSDMLEPVAIMFQTIEGSVVISSSWRSLMVNYDIENSLTSFDTSVFWQEASNASGHVIVRDIVSDNKFIFTPKYQSELYNYPVYSQATLPAGASEDDIWVDTFEDENYVYQCDETYGTTTDQAAVTLSSDYLASTTDLLFTYDTAGLKYVRVVLIDGGASGVASVAITGDADDRSNPLTYTYTLYDDNSSNDVIIALNATDLTVTGSDANDGGIVPTSIDLENPAADKWTQQVLHMRYLAIFPQLANDDDPLPEELPVLIREGDCLAYIAAYKLLQGVKGDERILIMSREYRKEARDILERCHKHRAGNGPPYDIEPS